MADLVQIGPFPCPLPPAGNEHLGGRTSAHWSGRSGLRAEQHAHVAAAWAGPCDRCGALQRPIQVQLGRGLRKAWRLFPQCSCRQGFRAIKYQLPPHGPESPVDVLLVRIPRKGGRTLDEHDGLPYALKAPVDAVAELLWPRRGGKLVGKVDDSASWLRWSYGQRKRHKSDPPNEGTELLAIRIAPRGDLVWPTPAVLVRWLKEEL